MSRLARAFCLAWIGVMLSTAAAEAKRPNIFIAISDDVSFPHASAYGSKMGDTPEFDRIAREGVLFQNAFCPAPGCSPSRAAFLTGRHIWMIEEAGTHASYFKTKYETFPERLAKADYFVGSTGKAWAPGNFKHDGRESNPAGRRYADRSVKGPLKGYAAGFKKFLSERPKDKPFCFWFGSSDAHRSYKKGSGLAKGKTLSQAETPGFLPDHDEIRSDLLDYAFEVERFDEDCGKMFRLLEEAGEMDNTLIIVTSDNGMPFPRAKANCYEFGIHMPMAIRWKNGAPGGRSWDDLVGFVDVTATIYEAAQVEPPSDFPVVGKSFLGDLMSDKTGLVDRKRDAVVAGRERHSSSRYHSLSYPQRAIRTDRFLYIRNLRPHRWPAGTPQKYGQVKFDEGGKISNARLGPEHGGYHDIDACPTLSFLIANRDNESLSKYLGWSVDKRPAEELFDIASDADCIVNLAANPKYEDQRRKLSSRLMKILKETGDARVIDGGDVWETYPRVSGLRWFPEPSWLREKTDSAPKQDWLEKRRPR